MLYYTAELHYIGPMIAFKMPSAVIMMLIIMVMMNHDDDELATAGPDRAQT